MLLATGCRRGRATETPDAGQPATQAAAAPEAEPDPLAEFPAPFRDASQKIAAFAEGNTTAWDRLAEMTDTYGHRLSGSQALEDAIEWSMNQLARDGMENARREPVMVPHWVRGEEWARIVAPVERDLVMIGLGNSVGTPRKGIRAELAVVPTFDDIEKAGAKLEGKIVLINQSMPDYDHDHHHSGYGETVVARTQGASAVAKHGALAVLVRSVTANSLRTPHTGALNYDEKLPKIPAAALSVEDTEFLMRMAARGRVEVQLKMGAKMLKDAPSANVVAELPGRERPDEIVVIGGHIDSWDVGTGATDDGSGCLMAIEAVRMLKELGLIPRRTIRVVLWTNEENGLRGAQAYFEKHGQEKHVAAIEADSGSGAPQGLEVAGNEPAVKLVQSYLPLFKVLGIEYIAAGDYAGADISPLTKAGVLGIGMRPDGSHYFDLHHSPADTIDKIDPAHIQGNAAAMALMAYILAERE